MTSRLTSESSFVEAETRELRTPAVDATGHPSHLKTTLEGRWWAHSGCVRVMTTKADVDLVSEVA